MSWSLNEIEAEVKKAVRGAGLAWGLAEGHSSFGMRVRLFFGACVVVAGVYGAISTGKRAILVVQALPALIAVFALSFAPSYRAP